jgi:hypothetical protein
MFDEIQGKIDHAMEGPPAQGARLPRWTAAALLSAGLVLPAAGCWDSVGPSAVYAGPPVREPETRPQPPPDEPEGKKGEAGEADPQPPPDRGGEVHPMYGVP